jgi:hypothetical protein
MVCKYGYQYQSDIHSILVSGILSGPNVSADIAILLFALAYDYWKLLEVSGVLVSVLRFELPYVMFNIASGWIIDCSVAWCDSVIIDPT